MDKMEIVLTFIFCAMLLAGGWMLRTYQCHAQWSMSGMEASWGPLQGCLVQHNGRWIPSENFREMP